MIDQKCSLWVVFEGHCTLYTLLHVCTLYTLLCTLYTLLHIHVHVVPSTPSCMYVPCTPSYVPCTPSYMYICTCMYPVHPPACTCMYPVHPPTCTCMYSVHPPTCTCTCMYPVHPPTCMYHVHPPTCPHTHLGNWCADYTNPIHRPPKVLNIQLLPPLDNFSK